MCALNSRRYIENSYHILILVICVDEYLQNPQCYAVGFAVYLPPYPNLLHLYKDTLPDIRYCKVSKKYKYFEKPTYLHEFPARSMLRVKEELLEPGTEFLARILRQSNYSSAICIHVRWKSQLKCTLKLSRDIVNEINNYVVEVDRIRKEQVDFPTICPVAFILYKNGRFRGFSRFWCVESESGSGSTDPHVFGFPDPDPLVRGMDPDPSIIMQK